MTVKPTLRMQDKLIAAAQNAITFQVQGTARFPFDMLRYDLCWPASEHDANMLAMVGLSGLNAVTLRGLKMPTAGRWESFGWRVVGS